MLIMRQPGQPLPKIWLMTDQRNDAVLEDAIRKLPKGSGIIFRHYHLRLEERGRRFSQILRLAKRQGHLVQLAGHPLVARKWGADGVHGRQWKRKETGGLLYSAPVHNVSQIKEAQNNGADLYFLSPAFITRSHPEAKPLNAAQLSRLSRLCTGTVILLGGMNQKRWRSSNHLNAHGWAAIDALSQSRFISD